MADNGTIAIGPDVLRGGLDPRLLIAPAQISDLYGADGQETVALADRFIDGVVWQLESGQTGESDALLIRQLFAVWVPFRRAPASVNFWSYRTVPAIYLCFPDRDFSGFANPFNWAFIQNLRHIPLIRPVPLFGSRNYNNNLLDAAGQVNPFMGPLIIPPNTPWMIYIASHRVPPDAGNLGTLVWNITGWKISDFLREWGANPAR